MKSQFTGAVLLVTCLLAWPARADFTTAVEAYDRGDYVVAYEAWLPLARGGDPAAQRNLGHLYRFGFGIAQDFSKAAYWYREAAEMGLVGAQANLAMMYLRGQGVGESPKRAAYWFQQAAAQGHALSQYNLGLLYLRGFDGRRDEARAMAWFHLAAKAGHRQALEALSKLVFNSAAVAGPPAPLELPPAAPQSLAKSGIDAAKRTPSPVNTAKDDGKVPLRYRPNPADQMRLTSAMTALHAGDHEAARVNLLPLARAGMAEALYQLGMLQNRGDVASPDRAEAYVWLTLAAERGHLQAEEARIRLVQEMSPEERRKGRQLLQEKQRPIQRLRSRL